MGLSDLVNDLLNCPFCGHKGKLWCVPNYPSNYPEGYEIRCTDCRCKTKWFMNENEAIKAWSRRTAPRVYKSYGRY